MPRLCLFAAGVLWQMKVQLIKKPMVRFNLAGNIGDVIEVDEKQAIELIEAEHAIYAEKEITEKTETKAPAKAKAAKK